MEITKQIMTSEMIGRTVARISHEICERNEGVENCVILGIKKRGVPLAKMIVENIALFYGIKVPLGEIDITLHRDDYPEEKKRAMATGSLFPCDITGKTVIIVDDVLFTGRSAKAAMETVFEEGRPQIVQLATLIDRGHRELPFRPDFVGKNIPTSKAESVAVKWQSLDGETAVYIVNRGE